MSEENVLSGFRMFTRKLFHSGWLLWQKIFLSFVFSDIYPGLKQASEPGSTASDLKSSIYF